LDPTNSTVLVSIIDDPVLLQKRYTGSLPYQVVENFLSVPTNEIFSIGFLIVIYTSGALSSSRGPEFVFQPAVGRFRQRVMTRN